MSRHDQIITPFLWRTEKLHSDKEMVSRTHSGVDGKESEDNAPE